MNMENKKQKRASACETCVNYDYDEFTQCYECRVGLDEDEMLRFLSDSCSDCPYYVFYDEYKLVEKQN